MPLAKSDRRHGKQRSLHFLASNRAIAALRPPQATLGWSLRLAFERALPMSTRGGDPELNKPKPSIDGHLRTAARGSKADAKRAILSPGESHPWGGSQKAPSASPAGLSPFLPVVVRVCGGSLIDAGALWSGGARVPEPVAGPRPVLSDGSGASETPPDAEKPVHTREPMVHGSRVGHSRGRLHLPHLLRCPL